MSQALFIDIGRESEGLSFSLQEDTRLWVQEQQQPMVLPARVSFPDIDDLEAVSKAAIQLLTGFNRLEMEELEIRLQAVS
jgi:hypothetical protein